MRQHHISVPRRGTGEGQPHVAHWFRSLEHPALLHRSSSRWAIFHSDIPELIAVVFDDVFVRILFNLLCPVHSQL